MNTMLDETLPLTTEEWIEWGNPNEKKAWDYMVQYSPYDNVKAQPYPNMLIEVSLNDSQVPYWEGAKLAAKIREFKTNDSSILLRTNMGAGHGGSFGVLGSVRGSGAREIAATSVGAARAQRQDWAARSAAS